MLVLDGYLILVAIAVIILLVEKSRFTYPPLISIGTFLVADGILLMLSARWLFSFIVPGTLLIILKFSNQLKLHYYKEHLMFQDFSLMKDVANFSILYHYREAGLAVLGFVLLLLGDGIASWYCGGEIGSTGRITGLMLAISGSLLVYFTMRRFHARWQTTLPEGSGTLANLVMSAKANKFTAPVYAEPADYFLQKMAQLELPCQQQAIQQETSQQPASQQKNIQQNTGKPDIILLLQESTVNPHLYALPVQTALPPLFMFQRDEQVSAQSPLRVQTFGGGTWLSEFSSLTGLNSDDFAHHKNGVFYFVVDSLKYSLFKEMKANGYYTVVFTSFNRSAYHSGHAYEMLGVDKILQPQDLGYPAAKHKSLWKISTGELLNYIKTIVSQHTDKPVFIFSLTISEHGPYNEKHHDDYQLSEKFPAGVAGQFSDYLAKISASDAAIADFAKFVAERKNHTLFLYFGDHQPHIGINDYQTTIPQPNYLTQFTLRDNLPCPSKIPEMALMDISFLGGLLLERAQLSVCDFWRANIAMRHLTGGKLDDCEDKKLLHSYKNYLYQQLKAADKVPDQITNQAVN